MTAAELTAEQVEAKKKRLATVGKSLKRNTSAGEQLFEERVALWEQLAGAGVSHQELADLADTTRENVKFALYKRRHRKDDESSSTQVG